MIGSNGDRDQLAQRQRHELRRRRAAAEGRHLPTVPELLRGFPFLGNNIADDAQTFAERLLPRLSMATTGTDELRTALEGLTLYPSVEGFQVAATGLQALHGARISKGADWAVLAMRCEFCAATLGCRDAAWRVAAEAVSLAHDTSRPDEEAAEYMAAAVGWLLFAAAVLPTVAQRPLVSEASWGVSQSRAALLGKRMLDRMLDHRQRLMERTAVNLVEQATVTRPPHPATEHLLDQAPSYANPQDAGSAIGIIVCREIGNPATSEGKRVFKEFSDLIGKPLPLHPLPDLAAVRRCLSAEFPHAGLVIDTLLTDMVGQPHLRFRPTLLVGKPGCGKTTFAQRLLEGMGVRVETFPCGGVADPALAGTPRRWATGEPSLPIALMLRWHCASPGIILDEIEKVGTSRRNGNLLDALLGLLEPQSALAWHDPYLEASIDLSHVLWLATANTLDGLPVPLRDRCRILRFPDAAPQHLDTLADALLRKATIERGLDPRWAAPLDGEEIAALRRYWRGGSLRRLARLVDGVIALRGRDNSVH